MRKDRSVLSVWHEDAGRSFPIMVVDKRMADQLTAIAKKHSNREKWTLLLEPVSDDPNQPYAHYRVARPIVARIRRSLFLMRRWFFK